MVIWAIVLQVGSLFDQQDVLADNVLVSGDPADPESGQKILEKRPCTGRCRSCRKTLPTAKTLLRILLAVRIVFLYRDAVFRGSPASFLRLSRLHVFHPFIFNPSDFRAGS